MADVEDESYLPDFKVHREHASTIGERIERVIESEHIVDSHRQQVAHFLEASGNRPGPIVVKTSTADLRARNHEPEIELLASVFEVIRKHFPNRDVLLTDGPAFKPNFVAIAEHHGWIDLANQYGVDVCDLNDMLAQELLDDSVFVAALHRDAACTISIVKAKTHRRTGISGAEKALVGYLSGAKMGYPKLERRHYLLPRIYQAVQASSSPMLHIIDGRNAIEGDGPLRGRPMETDFLLIGENPVALDVELARLYRFDPVLVISLFHSLAAAASGDATGTVVRPTLFATEDSMTKMLASPARPPREQPWLYRSLDRQDSWRTRRTFGKIRKAFRDVAK